MKGAALVIVAAVVLAGVVSGITAGPKTRPTVAVAATTTAPLTCVYRDGGALPDPRCTPGAYDRRVTQRTIRSTICKAGWAATVRPPQAVTEPWKFQSMRAYGVSTSAGFAGQYEYDHLVPIELGGATVKANLWPEPHYVGSPDDGSHAKDRVENRLRREVCAGTIRLAAARRAIRTDWITAP